MKQYDYIIVGGGAAGLSLLMQLVQKPSLAQKRILVLDKDAKQTNDRTWCFWQASDGPFENIIHKTWPKLTVTTPNYSSTQAIAPYQYKMLRGIDFYQYCRQHLSAFVNIEFLQATVSSITSDANGAVVEAGGQSYKAQYVFSSVLLQAPQLSIKQDYLLQHFKGIIINTTEPIFDADTATYMDFNINQQHGTAFVYVLPLSPRQALVEYTLFTANELTAEQYDEGLKSYINQNLGIAHYTIEEVEQGIIPMTDYKFKQQEANIIYIGTAGGCTRPSTGYTFIFIQKQVAAIVELLATNKFPAARAISKKAQFYDAIFLGVLAKHNHEFAGMFGQLFKKVKISTVLRFLEDESSFWNDLKIILAMPKWPFIKAFFRKVL
jgi:lycopene beta-cyclase